MKTYRIVVYDQNHKVADAKAFEVSDETWRLYVTVEDKRFELLLPDENGRFPKEALKDE